MKAASLLLALLALATPGLAPAAAPAAPASEAAPDYRARLPQDEIIYFLLPDRFANGDPANDRGGRTGDRLATGFDPAAPNFYHGGDLQGVIDRLDYIQGLGATALWVAPIFRNKTVQGAGDHASAGYHGYWITDFEHVDPHFGTDADFARLVAAAHARGMKLYMDIVVNHTADIIQYRECVATPDCPYRSRADYPYLREGGVQGRPINAGFAGDAIATTANFARLTNPDYAYHPFVPPAEARAKNPAWLNDPRFYHNRGNSTFKGESSTMGDFGGLDDVMTEDPRVIAGMIAIYGGWIDRFHVDGFRIDTAQHVDPAFWRAFVPAMEARARAAGIPHFHIFGEVATEGDPAADAAKLAQHTRVDGLPAVLDFGFRDAVLASVAGEGGTDALARLFFLDPLYAGGEAGAAIQPTFVSNHDAGRFAMVVRRAFPLAPDAEILERVLLGHALMLTLRGVPTVYAGDEQGFVGHGGDQFAREDQFASLTPAYLDQALIGTRAGHEVAHYDPAHPLYRAIGALARLRTATPALRRGRQVVRAAGETPGLFAASRFDPENGREVLLLFNTASHPIRGQVAVETGSVRWRALAGACAPQASAPGSVAVALAPFGYAVCAAE
ncbi:alpha-amylase family glycosyl hydrolase [Sphingomonas morindae]|uniref:Alpha-amylase n=1 Tax=Sphingomonas morindae TaxID=1541170 RepID=A0ABY4XE48_9SPHN|nr:alpha-amylase family glycosyl hydrolase [Sphingomonas morindae]USI75006.1 alpha-amylase [Sphingomonas morindae]